MSLNIKEFMDATGVDFHTASDMLYGVVGSNTDTRDWDSILSSGQTGQDLIDTVNAATDQMYGGVTVQENNGQLFLVAGNGTILRGVNQNTDPAIARGEMQKTLTTFGVSDSSWIDQDWNAVSANNINEINSKVVRFQEVLNDPNASAEEKRDAQNFIENAPKLIEIQKGLPGRMEVIKSWGQEVYAPLAGWENTTGFNLITGLSQAAKIKRTEEAAKRTEDENLGVVQQTITPPQYQSTTPTQYTPPPPVQAPPSQPVTPPATLPTQTQPFAPPSTTILGTFPSTTQTGSLSAVPGSVTVADSTAGYTPSQLSQTMPGTGGMPNTGVQTVTYANQFGQQIPVTEMNGQPLTYVPPGFGKATAAAQGGLMRAGYAEGGQSQDKMLEAKYRIASMNGYNGPKTNQALDAFANASPAMTAKFNAIGAALAKGGYIRKAFAPGGLATLEDFQGMQQGLVTQTMQPMQAPVALIQPTEQDFIPTTSGQAAPIAPLAEVATIPTTAQASMPALTPASVMQAATAAPQVQAATEQLQAAQGQVQPQAQVQAAQQANTSVAGMQAAQGTAIMMDNPVQRQIQQGELVSGAANAQTAAAFTEQVQAATATPSKQATVQGQLESLMQQFEGGNTPAWAAASMRNAMGTLAARGLGASSLAGQAVIQATMEAALPIAQMDAQVQAQFEAQNLSNRQQRAMLAAQQRAEFLGMEFTQEFQARVQNSARIGDIANMNFTAEQQIALENSRAANTVNLNNLNNRQAMVMAEAAALSQLDMQNLSNRQQAAVQNAQNFLQMDLTNLSNEQQATMFKAQSVIQSLFTDQAAENAAKQFNASSENQTNQFFASLASNTSQFNTVQQNAMDQFNVNSVNAIRQFNSEIQQQRDMFNAQNGLVVAQANAQWRQNIATLNTASQNQSNMDFAKTINALTSTNLDQIWQRERDMLSMAYQSAESNADRALSITLQKMAADATIEAAKFQADVQADIAKGQGWANVFSAVIGAL